MPSTPFTPDPLLDIGLAALLGLLAGLAVVLLRGALDRTVGADDLAALGVPFLGTVPRAAGAPIVFADDPAGAAAEAYRLIRSRLRADEHRDRHRIIAVTSALAGEGRTAVAANLAAVLALSGSRVCLIELDLRHPSLATLLGLDPTVGFTTALRAEAPLHAVLQNVGANLAAMTAGPLPERPSDVLISVQAKSVLDEIAARVDYVVIDTAPLLPVADAAHVAALADSTLVVHRRKMTRLPQVRRTLTALDRVGVRPLGAVLTEPRSRRASRSRPSTAVAHSARHRAAADPEAHRAAEIMAPSDS